MQQAVFFNQVLAPLIDAASWRAALGVLQEDTPASASAAGVAGTVVWDANFIYVCVATDTWKRVAISTW